MKKLPLSQREAVSVREAAELLGKHEDTIYRLIYRRRLVAFRMGRSICIHKAALAAYVRQNSTQRRYVPVRQAG